VKVSRSTPSAQRTTPKAFASRQLSSQASVDLHIDELVLDGFASGDRYTIGDAVERELARLLGEEGIPISLRSESQADELRGEAFNAAHDMKPPMIGRQIATAVYQAFGQ
jgi:hypothetical protein